MFAEDFTSITPVNFFQLNLECSHLEPRGFPKLAKKYLLPDTSVMCNEEHFADVSMGWNREGLEFFISVDKPFEDTFYPQVDAGDSVELFIDTRDVKTSGYNTRFCHHFFFLPEEVEGHQKGELTHFRTEDVHELCDPADLKLDVQTKATSYTMHIGIPRECLTGYDPDQFDRMGFTYRINRPYWASQHLSVVSTDYQLEQQPSLWAQVRFIKES